MPEELPQAQGGLWNWVKNNKFAIAVALLVLVLWMKSETSPIVIIILVVAGIIVVLSWIDQRRTAKKQDLKKNIHELAKDYATTYFKDTGDTLDYTNVDADEITPGSKKYGLYYLTQQVLILYDAVTDVFYGKQHLQLTEYQNWKEKNKVMSLMAESTMLADKKKMEMNRGII